MRQLQNFGKIQTGVLPYNDLTPNLVEVMSCEGGCISGPCVINQQKVAEMQIKKYVEKGKEESKE